MAMEQIRLRSGMKYLENRIVLAEISPHDSSLSSDSISVTLSPSVTKYTANRTKGVDTADCILNTLKQLRDIFYIHHAGVVKHLQLSEAVYGMVSCCKIQ